MSNKTCFVSLGGRKFCLSGQVESQKHVHLDLKVVRIIETSQVLCENIFFSVSNSLGDNCVGRFKWDALYIVYKTIKAFVE